MHKLKPDGPHRPGRKLFNWHGSEVKLNAQFSRIVKPAAYLATRSTGSATEQPQKKGLRPAPCLTEIKHVENVSFVSTCLSVPPAVSVPNVVKKSTCGGRLQRFWETWLNRGSNPLVVLILQEGYKGSR